MKIFTFPRLVGLTAMLFVAAIVVLIDADIQFHKENHAKIAIVQTQAVHAERLAQHDHAMIIAVCRAFNARDRIEAYYDNRITNVAQKYVSVENPYVLHVRPIFEQRDREMTRIAASDCAALMQRAILSEDSLKKVARAAHP